MGPRLVYLESAPLNSLVPLLPELAAAGPYDFIRCLRTRHGVRCRPEIQARHTAFKRGSAYLERYCLLIAFTAYLEAAQRTGADMTFEEWMAARPDVGQARDSILENPAGVTWDRAQQCGD